MFYTNLEKLNQAVILAGGRGERMKPFTDTMPKPMYPVDGEPFIFKLIKQVRDFGIKKVLLLLGYKSEIIIDAIGDKNSIIEKFGVDIEILYDATPAEYDTGDRLVSAKEKLDDRFLLMYCDNYCPIDIVKLNEVSLKNDAIVTLSVYSNKDNWTKNNLIVDENNKVIVYDKKRTTENLSGVDIGYAIVKKESIDYLPENEGSFAKVYPLLVETNKLYALVTEHRYYSIGSMDRMKWTEEFFKNKKVAFLDRDGTLNVRPDKACYVEKPEDFIWIEGAKEAVKLLNDNNYIVVLISNQPGIARGNLTEDMLQKIHDKMQNDLSLVSAKIDYIYYCPHNWDEGCECRKPKPGMLYKAQKDLSIDLTKAVLFGDDERDIACGNAANVKSILVSDDYNLLTAVKDYLKL